MPAEKTPDWKGDLVKCPYCAKSVFPHTHTPSDTRRVRDDEFKPDPRPHKDFTPSAIRQNYIYPGRRGRPMKAETIELLRICDCE